MFFFIKHQQTREKELEHPCGSVGIRSCSVLESTVVFPFFLCHHTTVEHSIPIRKRN